MSERIRVLHVLTSFGGFGGIQDYVTNVVTRMDRSRFDVEVAAGPGDGPYPARLREAGIPLHRVSLVRPIRPWTDLTALVDLVRLLRARRYDVVHAHMSKGAFIARLAARIARTPLVVFAGHNFGVIYFRGTPLAPLFWIVDKVMAAAFTDVVVSVAEYVRREVVRLRMVSASKIVTVVSGVDVKRLDAEAEAAAPPPVAGPAAPADGPLIGTVARLAPEKGLLTLIEAAVRVVAAVPAARFVVVGDGRQRPVLEAAIRRAGLEGRFVLLGARSDVARLLRRFDVFVLPSRSEGLPIALMEAMAAARPAVATRVGGVGELIVDGESGLLVPPGDARALGDAILSLLANPGRRLELGAAARRVIETTFALDRMVREIETVYLHRLPRPRVTDAHDVG